jgi:hypothetical protein
LAPRVFLILRDKLIASAPEIDVIDHVGCQD